MRHPRSLPRKERGQQRLEAGSCWSHSNAIKGQVTPGHDLVWSFTGSATPTPGSANTYTAEMTSATLPPNGFVDFYFPATVAGVERFLFHAANQP